MSPEETPPPSPPEDEEPDPLEELIRRTEEGDPEAWGLLYEEYQGLLRDAAERLLESRPRAEDVVQSFFADLPHQLRRFAFQGEEQFEAWLKRAIRRDALDRRSHHARRESLEPEATAPRSDRPPDLETRMRLLRALEKLDDRSILTVILHDLDGYSHAEIAEMLACSRGASRTRLYRARKKLARLLVP